MKSLKMKLIYRKHKKAILGTLGAVLLAGLVFFFSYFHVTKVEVMGTSRYTDEQVKEMALRGAFTDNSVLSVLLHSRVDVEGVPFVEGFHITRLSHNSICISVREKKAVGCIPYLDSYIYFDRNGIFVEGSKTRDESVPYFDGIQVNKVVMDEKLDIKGETVLNTAVALSTIFQKNDKIPDHIQFDSSYSISLIYGDVTVQLGKDENLEEKMNRVLAILPDLTGKKGILHMESVSSDMNTFEEEQEEVEITAENWNGGYDENGDYTGDGEYDENGNYVGAKPMTALEEAITDWNGGYDEEGDYTGAGEYDADGNYVGPKPTQESLDAAAGESDSSDNQDGSGSDSAYSDGTYADGSEENQGSQDGTGSDWNGDSYGDSGDGSDSSQDAYEEYSSDGSEDYNSDGSYSGDSGYGESYYDNEESY